MVVFGRLAELSLLIAIGAEGNCNSCSGWGCSMVWSSHSFNFGYYPAYWRPPAYRGVGPIWFAGGSGSSIAFAVEEAIGLAVLNQFLGGGVPEGVPTELRPLALEGELHLLMNSVGRCSLTVSPFSLDERTSRSLSK